MANHELQPHPLGQIDGLQDAFMPEAGPALIHNLSLYLRDEIIRLFMDNGEQILLPIAKVGVVIAHEDQDVLFGI